MWLQKFVAPNAKLSGSSLRNPTGLSLPPGPVGVAIKNPDGHQYSLDDAYTLN